MTPDIVFRTSEQTDEIVAALAKAQGEMEIPVKNQTAVIPMKAGGTYSFKYADLAEIQRVAKKPLADSGIAHTSAVNGGWLFVRLMKGNQWLESSIQLPGTGDPKVFAGNITYFRRYLFTALTDLAADDDLDDSPQMDPGNLPKPRNQHQHQQQPPQNQQRNSAPPAQARPPVQPRAAQANSGAAIQGSPSPNPSAASDPEPTPPAQFAGQAEHDQLRQAIQLYKREGLDVAGEMMAHYGKGKLSELTIKEFNDLMMMVRTGHFKRAEEPGANG